MIYQPPLDEKGKPYWVPVVVKDKAYLVGYLDAFSYLLFVLDFPGEIDLNLDSSRLNDVLDDGSRLGDLTTQQIENKLVEAANRMVPGDQKKKQKAHPDNKVGVLKPAYLEFDCECGMYYAFHNKHEIPEENFKCGVCSRVLIDYVGHSDDEYDFDGDEEKIAEIEKLREMDENPQEEREQNEDDEEDDDEETA